MRSTINFVMHPQDESEFVRLVLTEPGTVLVDGPRWKTPEPPIVTSLANASDHLMIWNRSENGPLTTKHYVNEGRESWYCQNHFLTIQFLRSGIQDSESPYLFSGRLAVTTTDKCKNVFDLASAPLVEQRFKRLRRLIKNEYTNGVLVWQSPSLPRSPTNPGKPDSTYWVGPHALQWLRVDPPNRRVQLFRNAGASSWLIDVLPSQ